MAPDSIFWGGKKDGVYFDVTKVTVILVSFQKENNDFNGFIFIGPSLK